MRIVIVLLSLLPLVSQADLITEIGGGIKFHTSDVVSSSCAYAVPFDHHDRPMEGYVGPRYASAPCGGGNPIFVGWPLAWEFKDGTRLGWFHQSNWFDGWPFNHRGESMFDCLCATHTFHWGNKREHP